MIDTNPKYQVECDYCGYTGEFNTKSSILKYFLVYENILTGEVAHFCCHDCAQKYFKIKKNRLEFHRLTKCKDFDICAPCVDIATIDEKKPYLNNK